MKKILGFSLLIFVLFFSLGFSISAQDKVELIFFRGEGCPHCAKEEKFLKEMKEKYSQLEVKDYEIWYNSANQKVYQESVKKYRIL